MTSKSDAATRRLPVYQKPGGHSKTVKTAGIFMLAIYTGMLVVESDLIMSMSAGEVLWQFGLPTLMAGVVLAMVLFDVSLGYPDDGDD